jgi:CheY-like chemotaxis protein
MELAPGRYLRLDVEDTGVGIEPAILPRIYEPFFTTKPVGKGTGLGLTQIFGFARQSGGHATISSTLGEGTRVSLYLPRHHEVEPRKAERIAPAADDQLPVAHAGATILVVEDDPRVSRSTTAALEELGYHPIPCPGGREALDALAEHAEVDLVLTDVMMPEMTGTELATAVRRHYPKLPVLFVTGYVGEAGETENLVGGELLRKPFTVAALAVAVESALGRDPVSESRLASTGEAAE